MQKIIQHKLIQTLEEHELIECLKNSPALKAVKKQFNSQIYLVGGSVRDILMNYPITDIDIVITNAPITKLKKLLDNYGDIDLVGRNFGVLKFNPKNKTLGTLDIALPRTESSLNQSGKRTDFVIKSNHKLAIEKDLSRRDFTVNSMAYNIYNNTLIDLYSGQQDLAKKIIKTTGEPAIRFQEDYSRLLRAIRFSCQLGFKLEKQTKTTIKKMASNISNEQALPKETIASEFLKACHYNAPLALELLFETNLINQILPELKNLKKQTIGKNNAYQSLLKTLQPFKVKYGQKLPEIANLNISIAVLFTFTGLEKSNINWQKAAKNTTKTYKKLKLSSPPIYNITLQNILFLLKSTDKLINYNFSKFTNTELETILFNHQGSPWLLTYLKTLSKVYEPAKLKSIINKLQATKKKFAPGNKLIKPFYNGKELMKLLKIEKGPQVGWLLNELREEQLSGKIKTKTIAKKFLLDRKCRQIGHLL